LADERPVLEVCVDDFYLGKYEVTQKQWKKMMGNNPSDPLELLGQDNYPVVNVSWNDVQQFISRLNRQSDQRYRLPTEAEWEYAARSGGKKEKWAGTRIELELGDYTWHQENSQRSIHPVGQKKPNGLGLFDMSGNVWEWCQDRYDKDYYQKSLKNNPSGPSNGISRVLRGGSWGNGALDVRVASRGRDHPANKTSGYGFGWSLFPGSCFLNSGGRQQMDKYSIQTTPLNIDWLPVALQPAS
jgi:formylglycine-generating enzyme required for sulfatase activity